MQALAIKAVGNMIENTNKIFLSYSGEDAFEASLLQFAYESLLKEKNVSVWTYQRDQSKHERDISGSLKEMVKKSKATIFLVSPTTLNSGAAQWMELAYSDAFEIPTFILLHHLSYQDLKNKEKGVPPLLLSGQCNHAVDWKSIKQELSNSMGVIR